MNVMTQLVGILSGDKIFKQAFYCSLLFTAICILFLSSFVSVLAQAGGIPGIDRPYRPGEAPPGTTTGTPLNPNDPNLLPPRTGGGGVGAGGVVNPPGGVDAIAAQAQAIAASENVGATPDGVLGFIHTYVLTGIGWVVGQAGKAFDYAISEFIVGFGRLYITGTGETIDALWGTVRDIFNLTFIFGLVYIGFKMILDSSDSNARKMLVSLIGAALLVNFSLFITKFVIDFSNIAATQIYNAFESSGQLSITNGFMTMMGINSLIGVPYTAGGSFAYVIGMLIIFAVLAYVFLAGAIMIIIRFVVLNIYMVFSPFMFLGWVFPALQSYSRDYWSGFLRQAFFAPAFIFMLYLSYRVASTFPVQRDLGHMFNPNGSSLSEAAATIPFFAMVIVFLCASMIVAKKMGAHGSTMAISVGNKIRGNAQSFVGRNSIGRLAGGFGDMNDSLEGSRTGRNFKRALSVASLGTFDERTRRNLAKAGKDAKFGGSYSRSDDKKFGTELDTTRAAGRLNTTITSGLSNSATIDEKIAFEQAITDASPSELLDQIKKYDPGSDQYNKIVGAMSHTQVTKLLDSKDDELSPSKRAKLASIRGEQIQKRLISAPIGSTPGTSGPSLQTAIERDASADDLKSMGLPILRTEAIHITAAKMDDLKTKLTPLEYGLLNSDRNNKLEALYRVGTPGPKNSAVFYKSDGTTIKKDSEIARLPKKILVDDAALPFLNSRVLDIALREGYIDSGERGTLRTSIRSSTSTNPNIVAMKDWLTTTSAGKTF